MTLLDALRCSGGGANALLRQSTAALLNSTHPNINYAYTQEEIISMVQYAFSKGNYEAVKNLFETENERGAELTDGGDCCGGFDPSDLGIDADEAPGLVVTVSNRIVFTYVVSNPGPVALADVQVVDDNETPDQTGDDFAPSPVQANGFNIGDSNYNGLLDPGEQWIFTARSTVTQGQHVSVASVRAVPRGGGSEVTDSDAANWLGRLGEHAACGGWVWHDRYHGSCHLIDGIQHTSEPGRNCHDHAY